jgi:hypothetical protein
MSYDMGLTASLPLRKKACCRFLSPSAGFGLVNLGSSDKHTNHYTTEDDCAFKWAAQLFSINHSVVRFHVPTVANMNLTIFWNVAPYSIVDIYQCLRGAYCLHHQDDKSATRFTAPLMEAVSTSETSVNFYDTTLCDIPEDSHHPRRLGNLKSHLMLHSSYSSRAMKHFPVCTKLFWCQGLQQCYCIWKTLNYNCTRRKGIYMQTTST